MASCDSSETEHQGADVRATDGEDLDRLLDEQRAYYRAWPRTIWTKAWSFPAAAK